MSAVRSFYIRCAYGDFIVFLCSHVRRHGTGLPRFGGVRCRLTGRPDDRGPGKSRMELSEQDILMIGKTRGLLLWQK